MMLAPPKARALFGVLLLALASWHLRADAPRLPLGAPAPELVGNSWLNLPTNTAAALTLASRKGKVTIVHFWTYGCINCRHNLSYYAAWQRRYAAKGVMVIGIHSPETDGESKLANVIKKVKELGITYPVLVDSNRQNWNRWGQHVWPAICLVDKKGRARYGWEGELEYTGAGGAAKMSRLIEALLKE
jgi:thiol-disulfide isomerase/thioredoxin